MNPTLIIAAAIAFVAYCICSYFMNRNIRRSHRLRAFILMLAVIGFGAAVVMNVTLALGSTPDINNDRIVDGADYGLVLGGWGPTTPGTINADINNDGKIDGADLGVVLGFWGTIVRNHDSGDGKPYFISADHDIAETEWGTRYSWGWRITPSGRRVRAFSIDEKETP